MSQRTIRVEAISQASGNESESLFERVHWLYAFCREHLFRDDTEQIAVGLWPDAAPPPQTRLLEIGCGPGFYSRQLAARFSQLNVTGIDRAPEQLKRARARVTEKQLNNCHFDMIWSIVGGVALVAIAAVVIVSIPDIKKYIKISTM